MPNMWPCVFPRKVGSVGFAGYVSFPLPAPRSLRRVAIFPQFLTLCKALYPGSCKCLFLLWGYFENSPIHRNSRGICARIPSYVGRWFPNTISGISPALM